MTTKRQKRRLREPEAQTVAVIRAICVERAAGKCEACGADPPGNWAPEMDHFWSRSREESVESCWLLCGGPDGCHTAKTLNSPSRLHWVRLFGVHVALHRYAKQVEKTRNEEALLLLQGQQKFSKRGAL